MKESIHFPKVTDIVVAIVRDKDDPLDPEWNVYLLNLKKEPIEKVLVSSKGYGTAEGRKLETTELRHYFENIGPQSYVKIEPIMEDVFKLTNQYWVSFFLNNEMHDKKYVFVPDSIDEKNFTDIPFMDARGVMIR